MKKPGPVWTSLGLSSEIEGWWGCVNCYLPVITLLNNLQKKSEKQYLSLLPPPLSVLDGYSHQSPTMKTIYSDVF